MKKILIIEDDKLLADLMEENLRVGEFEIVRAMNAEEGLLKARAERPALILLDILLPGMNGFELFMLMKKDPELMRIPVIIVSNLGQKEEIDRGFALGAKDYLVKAHLTLDKVLEKVKAVLNGTS